MKGIYLIGAASEKIAADLGGAELHRSGDLETAVRQAFARAVPGDAVLLSPACASFDQFHDFEERGRAFKAVVSRLTEIPLVSEVESSRPTVALPLESPPSSVPLKEEQPMPKADPHIGRWEEKEPPASGEPKYIYEMHGDQDEEESVSPTLDFHEAPDPPDVSSLGPVEPASEPVSPYEVLQEEVEGRRRQKTGA